MVHGHRLLEHPRQGYRFRRRNGLHGQRFDRALINAYAAIDAGFIVDDDFVIFDAQGFTGANIHTRAATGAFLEISLYSHKNLHKP